MIYLVIAAFLLTFGSFVTSYVYRVKIFDERNRNSVTARVLSGVRVTSFEDMRFIDLYRVRRDLEGEVRSLVDMYMWTSLAAILLSIVTLVLVLQL